jgi:hypothetical protein
MDIQPDQEADPEVVASDFANVIFDNIFNNKHETEDIYKNWLDSYSYREYLKSYLDEYELPEDIDVFQVDSNHPFLAVNSFFTRFKVLWCRGGDQTLFIKKSLFEEQNGFNEEYVVMEDFELIKRLWKKYPFRIIPKSVSVSARKYELNGYWKINLSNLKIFRMFMDGYHPQILKEKYFQLIKHPKA